MFQNEITAYLVILPALRTDKLTPECYFVDVARPLLVLQDLRQSGFRMADSKLGLGYAESALTLQVSMQFFNLCVSYDKIKKPTTPAFIFVQRSQLCVYLVASYTSVNSLAHHKAISRTLLIQIKYLIAGSKLNVKIRWLY